MRVALVGLLASLTACSQSPGTGTMATIGPSASLGIVEITADADAVSVVESAPAGSQSLGPLFGVSCQNSLLDPPPSKERALQQLKQRSLNIGATGVVLHGYERKGTSLATNCWALYSARGTAFRISP